MKLTHFYFTTQRHILRPYRTVSVLGPFFGPMLSSISGATILTLSRWHTVQISAPKLGAENRRRFLDCVSYQSGAGWSRPAPVRLRILLLIFVAIRRRPATKLDRCRLLAPTGAECEFRRRNLDCVSSALGSKGAEVRDHGIISWRKWLLITSFTIHVVCSFLRK